MGRKCRLLHTLATDLVPILMKGQMGDLPRSIFFEGKPRLDIEQ
jgi:hypothetical protein